METEQARTEILPMKAPYQGIVIASALIFMTLPFITAFNEILTAMVVNSGLYTLIELYVVPAETRMVAGILQGLFGVSAVVSLDGQVLLVETGTSTVRAYINWNCIGWQSLVIFALTVFAGLRGPYTRQSKILMFTIGLEGTVLLNLLRIVVVVGVASFWGYLPAVVFHDYAGTLLLLAWLVLLWNFSYKSILKPSTDVESGGVG